MWRYIYSDELYHYGVKGMKWGVRRTPEQLGHRKKSAKKIHPTGATMETLPGHKSSPPKYKPNVVVDHLSKDGKVDARSFYDKNGVKEKDIHATNHGNPKSHNYGKHGEHVVEFEWNSDYSIKNKSRRELTDQERKENKDIL